MLQCVDNSIFINEVGNALKMGSYASLSSINRVLKYAKLFPFVASFKILIDDCILAGDII